MKKILIISYADDVNGAEGSLRLATRYWRSRLGWEIDVFHPKGEAFKDVGKITEAGMNPLPALISGTHYDFVLINLFHNLDWIDRIGNVPIVFWVHEGFSALDHSNLTISYLTNTFLKVQSIIFSTQYQSEILFKSFLRDVDSKRIHIVPYAIESLNFKENGQSKRGVKRGQLKISWVGSVIARKRPLDLVQAVQQLTPSTSLKVDFIGPLFNSWSLGEEFGKLLHSDNAVMKWHDAQSYQQTMALISHSDIFCFTSEDESTGLAPLEAASLGVPVILARLPVYEFIGWKDQKNCLMYPVGDTVQLAECILKISNNQHLRDTLIRNGSALAKQYGPENFLEKITNAVSYL